MMAGVYFVFRPAQLAFQEILEYWDSVLIPLVAAKFPAVIVLLRGGRFPQDGVAIQPYAVVVACPGKSRVPDGGRVVNPWEIVNMTVNSAAIALCGLWNRRL